MKSILPPDFDVNSEVNIVYGNQRFPRLLDFAFYCEAIYIQLSLLNEGAEFRDMDYFFLFDSGSKSVLRIMDHAGFTFENTLIFAVLGHQNRVAEWLLQKYDQSSFKMPKCVFFNNTFMLFRLMSMDETNKRINEQDELGKTCLHWAVEKNNFVIAAYLLLKGIDKNIKDENNKIASDYAESEDIKSLFNFFK